MSSKIFDYIFIDLDGPILDGKLRHYSCYKDILNTYGGEAIAINAYWRMKRNRVPRDVILKKSCFQADYQTFLHAWMQNIELPKYLSLDTLKPNVAETLSKWQKLTQKITLVTMRQNRKNLCAQLKKLSIYNHFDEIIDCPPTKKNSKYLALKDKNLSNAIFIGDTEEDMNAANMLNISSIAITTGLREKKFLDAKNYYSEIKNINFII